MKELIRIQSMVFLLGGVLMVIGAAASMLQTGWSPYVFAVGAILYVAMQLQQRYEGHSFVVRRLRRMIIISDVLFLVAALMMFASQSNFFGLNIVNYLMYVHNNWVVLLMVAAILQVYATHRIDNELSKEKKL
jgi:hypothetical protein